MLAFAWNQRGSVLGEKDNFKKDFDNFVLKFWKNNGETKYMVF
jgi:hypothetical protein